MRRAGLVWLALLVLFCGCKRQPSRSDGELPIHKAVSSGDLSRLRRLLAVGAASPNALDRHGWMPIHRAVDQGHAAMVELLLKYGADPDADGPYGPPLHMAITEGHGAVIRRLIDGGADVNVRDGRIGACTALQYAMWGARRVWRDEVIEILLDAGADPRLSADGGGTVLHGAAAEGLTKWASLFLSHGADINAQTARGSTPLHSAVWANHTEMATFLLDHGADINSADQVGDTPLHIAAVNGYASLFALLRERKGDPNARNDLGQTPLDCMRRPDEPNMVVLHADGQSPYEVIFTLPATVGGFLAGHGIEFDHVWTPSRNDIEGLDLEAAVKASDPLATKSHSSMEYILEHFTQYHREYAGFLRQGRKYLICNMYFASLDTPPRDGLTAGIMDAWCDLVTTVVDLENSRVVSIDCSY